MTVDLHRVRFCQYKYEALKFVNIVDILYYQRTVLMLDRKFLKYCPTVHRKAFVKVSISCLQRAHIGKKSKGSWESF